MSKRGSSFALMRPHLPSLEHLCKAIKCPSWWHVLSVDVLILFLSVLHSPELQCVPHSIVGRPTQLTGQTWHKAADACELKSLDYASS